MMASNWFGSLSLAAKYALVFGCLLAAVVIAGGIKVMFDKRKMRRHVRLMDLEAGSEKNVHEAQPTMRKKDGSDLFGVRALEAGYTGGVAQSRHNSLACSLVGSPSPSALDLTNANFSRSVPSPIPVVDTRSRTFSAGSSILRLSQFGTSEPASPSVQSHYESSFSENGLRKKDMNTLKLRPSTAEQSKRHTHSPPVNMDLTVPPSPLLQFHPRFSQDMPRHASLPSQTTPPVSPTSVAPSMPTPRSPTLHSMSVSEASQFSDSLFSQFAMPDYYPQTPTLSSPPKDLGKHASEVPSSWNPHSSTRSMRGSVVSPSTSSNGGGYSPPPEMPSLADKKIKFPAFPARVVIDSKNAKFSGFVKERSSKGTPALLTSPQDNGNGYYERASQTPNDMGSPTVRSSWSPAKRASQIMDKSSPTKDDVSSIGGDDYSQTSFSFSMTNPDYQGPGDTTEPRKFRIGEIPMSSLTQHTSSAMSLPPLTLGYTSSSPLRRSLARV